MLISAADYQRDLAYDVQGRVWREETTAKRARSASDARLATVKTVSLSYFRGEGVT